MGRMILSIALIVGVWLSASGTSAAKGKEDKNAAPAAQAGAISREVAEREKAIRDWQAKLSGSRWELEVKVSQGGPATVVEADVLTFEHGTIGSETLAKAGYPRVSYALYPPAGESVAWEAMQSKDEKGVQETVIWRGEVTGEKMQGTLIKKRTQGEKETMQTFAFTGRLMAAAPAVPPTPVPAETPNAAPAPEAAPAAPEGSGSS